MAIHPSMRRNLQPHGDAVKAGAWQIQPLVDLVSEKRYLHYSLKSRSTGQLAPSVLTFRSDCAVALAPDTCCPAISTTIDGEHVEFLTDNAELVALDGLNDNELESLFDMLFRTLRVFGQHHFHCGNLADGTIGRLSGGGFVLLPNAYILPFFSYEGSAGPSSRRAATFRHDLDIDAGRHHLRLISRLIEALSLPVQPRGIRRRLLECAKAIEGGAITGIDVAFETVVGRPVEPGPRHARRGGDSRVVPEGRIAGVAELAANDGSVVLIRGDSYTGKTAIIQGAAQKLENAGGYDILPLDEWDLFTRSRRKAGPRSSRSSVWVIDDIDEKAMACSEFSLSMMENDNFPKGSVLMSVRATGISDEVTQFIETLRRRRGERFHEIVVEGDDEKREARALAEHLRSALRRATPSRAQEAGQPTPGRFVKPLLSSLSPEARQLLEFLAVARFAMPLDVVLTIFSDARDRICPAILGLVSLDLIDIFYRPHEKKDSLFLKVGGTALRRLIYNGIPKSRRQKLHRTVAFLGEQQEDFPRYLLLLHCLESAEPDLAARDVVGYLRETRSDRRHPSVVALCARLWQEGLLDNLAFSDRVLANHDLVNDLLRLGRTADAEEILLQSRELFENSEDDQKLKEAPHLSALMRRLADRWEARGDFRRALTLLEDVREDLQSALSLPDQAQLLNDVGWLQYRLADYQQSMESCRLSLNTLNAQQYPLIVAQALNLMGVVHLYTSRYDEAISYFERSAYLRERSGDENLLAASYNNFALVYQAKGDFEKALDYHNKSLNLKKRQNNRAGIAAGYLNLALLHLESRNFKEAETKCRESLEICGELGNTQLIADNTITLGDIALEGDDFEAAERQYDEARRMSKEQGAINEEMGALRRLASLCIKRERFDEAREHADNAHELVKRIGSKYEEAQIEVILGDLELEQKRHLEALDHFERAATQYSSLSKYRLGATVLSKIGLIHAENGNNFEARHYLERAQEYGRADIGRELPEEFVKLQHALRAHHAPSLVTGQESQKLLMAFYDLSAMTDYALDPKEFLRKVMEITRRIADPIDCYLGLKVGESYMVLDGSGESVTSHPSNIDRAFDRALTLGRLIDSGSADAAEVNDALTLPSDRAFVAVPLKAMGEDLACMFFLFQQERVPLSKEDVNFFTWLGRQIAGNLKLMLNLNENFLKAEGSTHQTTRLQTAAPSEQHRFKDLIGKSETMKKIFRTLEKVRDTDASILIMGESGTGKSALAAAAHYNSPRSNRPFQEIHCAQIPHNLLESELFGHERGSFTGAVQRKLGLCEMANGGTLFLDDINVMPVETQTKLLHFLESKSFHRLGGTQRLTADVRIIAASNEDLETLCREGRFREDLFYRLKVILIDLPPLRERKEDMIAIALQYLKRSCTEKGIPLKTLAPETIQLLQKAPWRGNVRELQNVLERVVVLSDEDVITPSSLPDDFLREVMGTSRKSHERLDELIDEIIKLGNYSETNPLLRTLEAMLAKRMVEHVEGKGHAASLLGVSKPTLYARLRDYDKMS